MAPFLNQQFDVDIKVFEGEQILAENNNLLGYFTLSNILFTSNKMPQIEITFDIDVNGILNVSAVEKTSQKENKITVTNNKGRLSKLDIENLINNFEKYDLKDKKEYERISAKNSLETYCYNIKERINNQNLTRQIDANQKKKINDSIEDIIEWLDANKVKRIFLCFFSLLFIRFSDCRKRRI
jgi:L1 cell adhesion molecule like protein